MCKRVAFLLQVIFQVSLVILDRLQDKLTACKDEGEAMTILAQYLNKVTNEDSKLDAKQRITEDRSSQVCFVLLIVRLLHMQPLNIL